MFKVKICEYLYLGARTVEYDTGDIVSIRCCGYIDPEDMKNPDVEFVGYDYPTVKKVGSFQIHLKNGETKVYPASNWQIEFN